ncbi:MAG: toll/interleukin-1 receptor domain-containing protein, partial [Anaerolineae bacterium]|nr:toll/interleukin-1 receptor domain-containing protein [Anaerolineae bacterium]
MKLFISYSRDDKAWVYELWRAIRDKLRFDPWIDQDLKGATRWWPSILDEIEAAQCVIMVLTQRSLESIYCLAELNYALALNKPILPLMLKPCLEQMPRTLGPIQFLDFTRDTPMYDVIIQISLSLAQVQRDLDHNVYPARAASRPAEPSAAQMEDIDEVYETAVDALEQRNFDMAEQKLWQVTQVDDGFLAELAAEKLQAIPGLRQRDKDYTRVKRLLNGAKTQDDGRRAWEMYLKKYGPDHDPDNLAGRIGGAVPPRRSESDQRKSLREGAGGEVSPGPSNPPDSPTSLDAAMRQIGTLVARTGLQTDELPSPPAESSSPRPEGEGLG